MTFDSLAVIAQLQDLEQKIAAAPQYHDSLQHAFAHGAGADILSNLMDSERHVRAMAMTTARIKEQVLAADGLGSTVESLAELILRGVRIVLLTELDALRGVRRDAAAHGRSTRLFDGRFQNFEELALFVRAELDRITRMWSGAHNGPWGDRLTLRAALRDAGQAMRQLGEVPELVRFLREGAVRGDWPALRGICRRMRAALAVRIAVEPDQPLLVSVRPLCDLTPEGHP